MEKNSNHINLFFFTVIILIGIFLRVYQVNFDDYWFDEYVSFWIADPKLSYKETISRIYEIDYGTNFLFNILLKYYFKLFNYSPEVGRFFPLIFGVLSIPLIGYLSYQFDKSKSYLFTTFLISINWYLISYSQETRSFSLSFLLSVLSIIFFLKIIDQNATKNNGIINGFFYVFFSFLGVTNHIFIFIIILSQFLFLIIYYHKNNKYNLLPFVSLFLVIIFYLIFMINPLIIQFSIKKYWISQVKIDFFINYYFSRFFGSKIMGAIYLLTLFFLIYKFKNKFISNSNKYLFLFILLVLSYLLPLLYGLFFIPVLTDRYIIFVLIPIIILISILTFKIENIKLKKIILSLIIVSTVANNYLEIFQRKHSKPEFNKIFKDISNTDFNFIYLKTPDSLNFKLLNNYILLIKNYNMNKFVILDSDKYFNKNHFWLICYKPINSFDCSLKKNVENFSIIEEINYHLIDAKLYSR